MRTLAALLSAMLALPAAAQAPAFPDPAAPDPAAASPFGFAQSGAKARRAAEAEAAGSGARVVGGQEAAPGAWPWQVALLIAGEPVGPDAQFCGGSMLLDTWVLTAAHCVFMQDAQGNWGTLVPQALSVLVGTNDLAPRQGDAVPVAGVFVHPGYAGPPYDNDIALLRLARPPQAQYATIKIPDAEFGDYLEQPGVVTTVTGWGLTEGGGRPASLRQADIQMMDRSQCNAALLEAKANEAVKGFAHAVNVFGVREDDAYALWDQLLARAPEPMSANMICSGTFEGGRTACSGDSGGPLVVALRDGTFVQAGIVSWGLSGAGGQGCAETAPFSAYTRVANYLPWLDSVIGANP